MDFSARADPKLDLPDTALYQLDEEEKATPRFVTGVEALSPGLGGCLKHWGQPLISHGCQIGIAGRTQLIEWAAATFS